MNAKIDSSVESLEVNVFSLSMYLQQTCWSDRLANYQPPPFPLFTPLTGCLLCDKTSVLWLRSDCDASYLMFVSSIQLNGYFGHFHGILDGLCPALRCCHGYAGRPSSGSLPGTVNADCKQSKSWYTAPCCIGSAVVLVSWGIYYKLMLDLTAGKLTNWHSQQTNNKTDKQHLQKKAFKRKRMGGKRETATSTTKTNILGNYERRNRRRKK